MAHGTANLRHAVVEPLVVEFGLRGEGEDAAQCGEFAYANGYGAVGTDGLLDVGDALAEVEEQAVVFVGLEGDFEGCSFFRACGGGVLVLILQ